MRLGAVTGVGHARLINERFGRFWGMFSVGDLFILNFLTIATEFIGVSLALGYFGVSQYVSVPIAAVTLVAMTATGSFRRWERFMFVFIVAELPRHPPGVLSHPPAGSVLQGLRDPGSARRVRLHLRPPDHRHRRHHRGSRGSSSSSSPTSWTSGSPPAGSTTSAPTPSSGRSSRSSRPALLMAVTAAAFADTPLLGHFTNAGGVAEGLKHYVGRRRRDDFRHHLVERLDHRCRRRHPVHLLRLRRRLRHPPLPAPELPRGQVLLHRLRRHGGLAAGIVIIPGAPLGVITTGVQALAGVLLPSATVFLLLLCNDKDVLGPWVNRPWLNVVAAVIVSILLALSFVLMITTLFTSVNVKYLALVLGGILLVAYVIGGIVVVRNRSRRPPAPVVSAEQRANWRMPPLGLLSRPKWSRGRIIAMWALRGYLVIAVVLLLVKAIELGLNGKG